MADPENTQVPNGDTRVQNNTESTSNDVGNEVNTTHLPDSNGAAPESAPAGSNEETEPKKPSKFKQAWGKLGLDLPTAMMMLKLVYTSLLFSYLLSFLHRTDVNPKGLNTPDDRNSLVSIKRYC